MNTRSRPKTRSQPAFGECEGGRLDFWPSIGQVDVDAHRQGIDLRLTQYERGWRATFYTMSIHHERDGHRIGADALARYAAGGVGGIGPRKPPIIHIC